ncbi:MAG: hypothetical protein H6633_23880 [Anaerolineales bacterium]|nr:hypothetical protein [Anaerolineales bacterium]
MSTNESIKKRHAEKMVGILNQALALMCSINFKLLTRHYLHAPKLPRHQLMSAMS